MPWPLYALCCQEPCFLFVSLVSCVCVCVCVCVVSYFSHVQLFAMLWAVACQAPLSMEVFRLEYWSGLSLPSTGNLADPGTIPVSPALQAYSLLAEPLGSLKVASVPWII